MCRIETHRLLERTERTGKKSDAAKMTDFQVASIGLEVADLRAGRHDPIRGPGHRRETRLHHIDDAGCNLILDREDIDRVPVESLRPQLVARRRIRQLRRHAKPRSGSASPLFPARNAEVREATRIPSIGTSAFMISSAIPSQRYS